MRTSWLVLLVVLLPAALVAEVGSQQEVLDSLIGLAQQHNPELSAAEYVKQAQTYAARGAGALPDPTLSLGVLNLPADSWSMSETPMSGVSLGLTQKIPWPGKLHARSALATEHRREAEAGEAVVRNRLSRIVTEAYLDYAYWSASRQIIDDYLTLLEATRDIAEVRYANGDAVAQDLLRAGSMSSRTEVRLLQANQKRQAALAYLRQAVGDTTISDQLPAYLAEPRDESSVDGSPAANPLLARAQAQVRQSQSRFRIARQEYWPDLTLGVDYRLRRDIMGDPVHGADFLTFKVGLSLPLWFSKKQNNDVRAADRMILASQQRERSLYDQLAARIDDAASNRAVIVESLAKYDNDLVPEATAAVDAAEAAYEVGRADFNALLSAQSDAFQIRLERLDLLRQYHKTTALLAELAGTTPGE